MCLPAQINMLTIYILEQKVCIENGVGLAWCCGLGHNVLVGDRVAVELLLESSNTEVWESERHPDCIEAK